MYTWILIIDNFVQIDIFLAYMMGMGRRQVVRHRTLTPLFVGSSPTTPENQILYFLPTGKTFLKKPLQVVFIGLVAQWIRARGYEPRCQGFKSLLARLKFLPH